jgi:hypothetical protein
MSNQTMADAFAPAEARYRAEVMEHTWGHLAPQKNKTYRGHVIFALGCFGSDYLNPTVLVCELGNLGSSPWFFDALIEFLQSLGGTAGGVYRFDGAFRNYKFKGTRRQLQFAELNGAAK